LPWWGPFEMRSNPLLEEIEEGDEGDHLVRERDYGLNVGLVHDVVAGDWNREGERGEQNGLSVLVLKIRWRWLRLPHPRIYHIHQDAAHACPSRST
jgi:hypothetical protein